MPSIASCNNFPFTHCRSPFSPRLFITTDGPLIGWPMSGTSVAQARFRYSTAQAPQPPFCCHPYLYRAFRELGPDTCDHLGAVALFPQGIHEDNLKWSFSMVAGKKNIFDQFYVLSLTYRNEGFITMVAPIRNHPSFKDPMSAPLFCSFKERCFSRLLADMKLGKLGSEEARWTVLSIYSIHPQNKARGCQLTEPETPAVDPGLIVIVIEQAWRRGWV